MKDQYLFVFLCLRAHSLLLSLSPSLSLSVSLALFPHPFSLLTLFALRAFCCVTQVLEVFTSGSALLQLRLPDVVANSSVSLRSWDLLPHQSKTVLLVTFMARVQGRFQGAVTVRTNKGIM